MLRMGTSMRSESYKYSDRHPGGMLRTDELGGAMHTHSRRMKSRLGSLAKTTMAGAALAAGVITLGGSAGAAASSAPGVTPTSITVGTISTQTGPISSN